MSLVLEFSEFAFSAWSDKPTCTPPRNHIHNSGCLQLLPACRYYYCAFAPAPPPKSFFRDAHL